jgi:hypothetical protein
MITPAKCFLAIERLRRLHTGQVLLRMLRHAGFTSAMIAAEVGVASTTIAAWRGGRRVPPSRRVHALRVLCARRVRVA